MFEPSTRTPRKTHIIRIITIFLVAIVFDIVVHFFSSRKYYAMKTPGTTAMGFAPQLTVWYRSLSSWGPFPYTPGIDTWGNSCNSWLMGALITGLTVVIIVIISEIIIYMYQSYNEV